MKAPRFAVISIALDTERYSLQPIDEHKACYLLNRLLKGDEVAESAFGRMGMKVTIREAFKKEII